MEEEKEEKKLGRKEEREEREGEVRYLHKYLMDRTYRNLGI